MAVERMEAHNMMDRRPQPASRRDTRVSRLKTKEDTVERGRYKRFEARKVVDLISTQTGYRQARQSADCVVSAKASKEEVKRLEGLLVCLGGSLPGNG